MAAKEFRLSLGWGCAVAVAAVMAVLSPVMAERGRAEASAHYQAEEGERIGQLVWDGNTAWGPGNFDARKAALGSNYAAVQTRVKEMLEAESSSGGSSSGVDIDALARAVIRGDYGNGETRKKKLGSLYSQVQKRVNELLL